MLPIQVCTQSSKCCISAGGTVPVQLGTGSPPSRVFVGVGTSCDGNPPIDPSTGLINSGWVEASSVMPVGSENYHVAFPAFAANDPRCVSPCNQDYAVCTWIYYANGDHDWNCDDFNPAVHCAAQPEGICLQCENDESL